MDIGRNIEATIKGDKLTLVINLAGNTQRSVSGKSDVLATTNGNVTVKGAEGVKLGLNIFRPVRA